MTHTTEASRVATQYTDVTQVAINFLNQFYPSLNVGQQTSAANHCMYAARVAAQGNNATRTTSNYAVRDQSTT